ncbi:MAG: hypothetical protein H5U02_00570 [Clostridia bacterium]|nr:hypothetical protein [Clostridia bacterium]
MKLNGVTIPNPHEFRIERYKLTKAGRVASGKMTMELVAKKRKFIFRYNVLSGSEVNLLLDILDSDAVFFTLEYPDRGGVATAIVYAGAINQRLFRTDGDWVWTDVQFDLIEQ